MNRRAQAGRWRAALAPALALVLCAVFVYANDYYLHAFDFRPAGDRWTTYLVAALLESVILAGPVLIGFRARRYWATWAALVASVLTVLGPSLTAVAVIFAVPFSD